MLDNITIKLISHKLGNDTLYKDIAEIKSFHWHYPISEHIRWMNDNILPDDYHLLIYSENCIVAYMNLVNRNVEIDKEIYSFIGIGNVCVHKDHLKNKLGLLLMDAGKYYLNVLGKTGILFCKDHLIHFYKKAGWILYYGKVLCGENILNANTFLSNSMFSQKQILKVNFLF